MQQLPIEMLMKIMSYLPLADKLEIANTCKSMRAALNIALASPDYLHRLSA
jgi:hypothetical protein